MAILVIALTYSWTLQMVVVTCLTLCADNFRLIWTSLDQNDVNQGALNYITNKFERKKYEINEKKSSENQKKAYLVPEIFLTLQ